MEYVVAYSCRLSHRRGPTLLDESATRASISADCRDAALSFMRGTLGGWSKRELCEWLVGPYAHATRHIAHGERTPSSPAGHQPLSAATLDALMATTRASVLAALEAAVLCDGTLDFAEDLADRNFVHRAVTLEGTQDEDGLEDVVWIPIDAVRMRLIDRVRSLFAADYLNDATDYRALYVCPKCENVVFDHGAKQIGMCFQHVRSSGIVTIDDDARTTGKVGGVE